MNLIDHVLNGPAAVLVEVELKRLLVMRGYGKRLKPSELARSVNPAASSVRSAARALYSRGILWDDWALGENRVRLEDPLFAHRIRMTGLMSTANETELLAAASAPAFARVWDNTEDAAYASIPS